MKLSLFKKNKEEKHEKEIEKAVGLINIKSSYGAKISVLNEAERVLYMNDIFQKEIENGGFAMLFFHPAGEYANEMVKTLQAIGAQKAAQVLQEAIDKFPQPLLGSTTEQRQELLEQIDPDDTLFIELNEAFSAMAEDITVYQTAYMLKHKAELK